MVPASDEDLTRWRKQGRDDILEKAKVITDPKTGRIIAAELWFNPHTCREYIYCPWIKRKKGRFSGKEKVVCQIHERKTEYCMDYICRKHQK
jgi:hypothetical protein